MEPENDLKILFETYFGRYYQRKWSTLFAVSFGMLNLQPAVVSHFFRNSGRVARPLRPKILFFVRFVIDNALSVKISDLA
jgi:hypothetical protein